MRKFLFMCLAMLPGLVAMQAQTFTDLVIGEDGTGTIQLNPGQNYFSHTATQTATLRMNVGFYGTVIRQCSRDGVAYDNALANDRLSTGTEYKIDVTEGSVYYFTTSYETEAHPLTAYYGDSSNSGIQASANYADGDVFYMTGRNLEVTFDRTVTLSSYVLYGDGQREEINSDYIYIAVVTQYYYTVNLRNLVTYLMDGGKIGVGDKFTISLEGIADAANPSNIYGDDGKLTITLELGEMPGTLEGIVPADGSTIYTYYPEGGEDGLIVLTFSEELSTTANVSATASYGDSEAGSFRVHNLPYTIEGNKLTADIRGIRFPEFVESGRGGSAEIQTTVNLTVSGLKTLDGRDIETNYPTAGTTSILAFYPVVKQNIAFIYDFIPQSGNTSLINYDEVVIWINTPILYDGVTLAWQNSRGGAMTRSYTADEVPFVWDDYEEGYLAHIPLAGVARNTYPINVQVDNAYLMNGDAVTIMGTFYNYPAAIDDVKVDANGEVKIYGIDGVLVGKSIEDLENLPNGLYIVNGKKVIVKK